MKKSKLKTKVAELTCQLAEALEACVELSRLHSGFITGKHNAKIDWSSLPEWVNWLTSDESGEVWGYDREPRIDETADGMWVDNGGNTELFESLTIPGDWKESLLQRPGKESLQEDEDGHEGLVKACADARAGFQPDELILVRNRNTDRWIIERYKSTGKDGWVVATGMSGDSTSWRYAIKFDPEKAGRV